MLDVGGRDSSSTEHLTWERRELVVGDEIRIIVEENTNTTGLDHRIHVGGAAESDYDLVKRTD